MSNEDYQASYRILDASWNRAGEGLRTMEELARFVLNDAAMTSMLKSLRHDLAVALQKLPREQLLTSRDCEADVGTEIRESSEYQRTDLGGVLSAAASRTQQALRVLEECAKTIDAAVAVDIEQIRYRSYTLCGRLELSWLRQDRRVRLREARLYVLVDARATERDFVDLVRQLCSGGVDILQLRDRQVDDRTLINRGRVGTDIARQHGKLFIMNDRADLALAADTDGVHVGQEELPVPLARRIIGPQRLLGVSTHSIQQARDAVSEGADYIGCGPVFPGATKEFDAYVGTALLKEVAAEIELPLFAIGGINLSNLDQVIDAGIGRIAVTGAVRDADDPTAAAKELRQRLSS